MAGRPRKPKKTIDEQILEIENNIVKYKEAIVTLNNKKEELFAQKREEEIAKVYDLLNTRGLTIDRLESILDSYEQSQENTNENYLEQVI